MNLSNKSKLLECEIEAFSFDDDSYSVWHCRFKNGEELVNEDFDIEDVKEVKTGTPETTAEETVTEETPDEVQEETLTEETVREETSDEAETAPTTEELSEKVDEILSTEPTADNLDKQIAEAEKVEKELESKIEKADESVKKASNYFDPHAFSNFWNGVTNGWDN